MSPQNGTRSVAKAKGEPRNSRAWRVSLIPRSFETTVSPCAFLWLCRLRAAFFPQFTELTDEFPCGEAFGENGFLCGATCETLKGTWISIWEVG